MSRFDNHPAAGVSFLWECKDAVCNTHVDRSYYDLATSGEPICPSCEGDMVLAES